MNKLSAKARFVSIALGLLLLVPVASKQSLVFADPRSVAANVPDQSGNHRRKKEKEKDIDSNSDGSTTTISTGAPCISWVNPQVPPKVALLCIHGLGLYSGAYADFGTRLARGGIATFAIDVRGFGSWMKAKGETDIDFDSCLDDIKSAVDSIHAAYPNLPVFLLGESMGGAIALRFASQHPEMIQGLISSVPGGERFKQKKTDIKIAMQLLKHPNKEFDIGDRIVDQATQNPQLRQQWSSDPLDRMDLSAKQLMQFQRFMNENHESAKRLTNLPVLFVQGTEDKLVKPEGTWQLFNELATEQKVFLAVPSEHLIFEDTQNKDEITKLRNVRLVTAWLFTHTPNAANETNQTTSPNQAPDLSGGINKLVAGQYADAIRTLEPLANSQPMNSEVHYWLGLAYMKNNQPLLARRQFVRAMALGKGSGSAKQANSYLLSIDGGAAKPNTRSTTPEISSAASVAASDTYELTGGKPAVLAFYANWCEQCNKLDILFKHGQSTVGDKVKFVKVDVDDPKNLKLLKDFKIGPIPTLIYLKRDGSVASTSIGETSFVNFADGLSNLVR
jgi:alpha-beta hydrolase superfamily lysophospholipase/thiol-disulfide isomerase/thioredoxin